MGDIKNFFNNVSEDNVSNAGVIGFILGIVGALYSIIAGIWGFAPAQNINWKIFGTSVIIIIISALVVSFIEND